MSPRAVLTFSPDDDQRQALEEILEPYGGIGFLTDAGEDPEARADLLHQADAVITWRPGRELTPADVAALDRAGLVQLLSAGADHVDFAALPQQAKVAGNVGAYADPMAEHVLAMALALAKRLPQNHARLASGTFDLAQTLRLRAYSLQTAGVQVRSELDPKLPAIPGDDRKLQQVLLNLIVNAEYAMHRQESRELAVCTIWEDGPDGGRVLIEVMDTGTGMAPELLKHIFEPFFTTKPAGVGTGLGLSVSYGIVHAHGGTITVRSTPGAGSTFVVTLPIRSQQLPSASPSPARAGRRSRPSAPVQPPADASEPAPSAAPSPSPSARASGRGPRQ